MDFSKWNLLSTKKRGEMVNEYTDRLIKFGGGSALAGGIIGLLIKKRFFTFTMIGFAVGAGYCHQDLKRLFKLKLGES